MPLSMSEEHVRARSEAARHAIQARWAKVPPEDRRRVTLPGRLAMAVRLVAENQDQLSTEQKDLLFVALYGPENDQ